MRAVAAAALVLLAATPAWARPRVQVAPFAVRGEALGYFGPEVARAMTAALEGAGVETGPGAEATITGRVDELGGDRVRLSATLRGRTLAAEGPLEAVDAVATQLANKIAPLLLENDPAAQRAAEKRAREAERRAAAVPPSTTRVAKPVVAAPPVTPAPAAKEPESAPESHAKVAATEPHPKIPASEPHAKLPAAEAHLEPTHTEPVHVEPKLEAKAEPPKTETKASEVKEPEWTPPRVDTPPPKPTPPPVEALPPAPPPAPSPYFAGYVRGRVVAHAISDPPTAYPGSGSAATQALFAFLHRRMRLNVIPTGVGISAPAVAADEGYRAGARAVVMARLEAVDYMPGPSVRCRLEVIVIRDGRPVMRRVVASPFTDPSRRGDPVYTAVSLGLEALVPELTGALADVR